MVVDDLSMATGRLWLDGMLALGIRILNAGWVNGLEFRPFFPN